MSQWGPNHLSSSLRQNEQIPAISAFGIYRYGRILSKFVRYMMHADQQNTGMHGYSSMRYNSALYGIAGMDIPKFLPNVISLSYSRYKAINGQMEISTVE